MYVYHVAAMLQELLGRSETSLGDLVREIGVNYRFR